MRHGWMVMFYSSGMWRERPVRMLHPRGPGYLGMERERPQTRSSLWVILEATDREYMMKGREVWAGAEGRLHRLQGRDEVKARSRF